MKTSSDHFHVCSTVGIESLPKRCIYPSWSLLYSIRLLILRERNNMWIEIEIEIICEFPCLQSGGFFAQQRPAHTPLPQCSSRWPTYLLKSFWPRRFYLIFNMVLYCFSKFSVLCYFSNFPPAANWHKDGQRVQRGARPISCFSQIFLFSKESCCSCNFQLFQ